MDYKKAYKETLNRAREIHRNEAEKRFDMEWLFPELKNEDERIREEMITAFSRLDEDSTLCGVAYNYKKWIAWLEKQKSVTCNTVDSSNDEKIRNALIRFHKSTIDVDGIKGADILAWLEKQDEQKPAWSDEDEEMLQSCTGAIWAADYYLYEDKQDMEAWLKRIKDRIGG